jgi:hypothetical protein
MPVIRIDPSDIYFTHSKIRHRFSGCGKTIEETLTELRTGVTKIEAIPKITVYYNGSDYFTQNNRRLYCYKVCKSEGLLSDGLIEVMIKALPKNKRYTADNCSLNSHPCLK